MIVALLAASQFHVVTDMFSLFSVTETILWVSLFNILNSSITVMSTIETIAIVLLSLAIGINMVVFITYLKQYRKQLSFAGTNLTLMAMVLGVFGVGCLSCGVLLLAPIISIFGISAAIWVTNNGVIISLIALTLVLYSSYILLRKISDPQVCEPLYE